MDILSFVKVHEDNSLYIPDECNKILDQLPTSLGIITLFPDQMPSQIFHELFGSQWHEECK